MRAALLLSCLLPALAFASPPPREPAFATDLPLDDSLTAEQALGAQAATEADEALTLAQQQLAAGKLEEVVATLEGRVVPESRKPAAAALLATVAERALAE